MSKPDDKQPPSKLEEVIAALSVSVSGAQITEENVVDVVRSLIAGAQQAAQMNAKLRSLLKDVL